MGSDRRRGSPALPTRAQDGGDPAESRTPGSSLPDSTAEVAHEDFLFHLYRGSELLQDSRVQEAKEELEHALTLRPLDAKGQDLLGTAYFRLGLYPRAIQIYEGLEERFERDVSIKVNLALCHLKTARPDLARTVLTEAVRLSPEHKRAWGYLGLAHQQLGDFEQARIAFERAGQAVMAKRAIERHRRSLAPSDVTATAPSDAGVRDVARTAFNELDAGGLRFSIAGPQARPEAGTWHTLEPGEPLRTRTGTQPYLAAATTRRNVDPAATAAGASGQIDELGPEGTPRTRPLFALLANRPAGIDDNGLLLIQGRHGTGYPFAARLASLCAISGTVIPSKLYRRTRDGETGEALGGADNPLVRLEGDARLALAPARGRRVAFVRLDLGLAFIREDVLMGFDLDLAYENGRLATDASQEGGAGAEPTRIVQLRGSGTVALELAGALASLASTAGSPLLVRRSWLVGWLGRLVVRPVSATQSPLEQRGLLSVSGEGTALLSPD